MNSLKKFAQVKLSRHQQKDISGGYYPPKDNDKNFCDCDSGRHPEYTPKDILDCLTGEWGNCSDRNNNNQKG